ncbi:MAG: phytoene synthase [Glaciecola sp.]|jgi:phytoene synthase
MNDDPTELLRKHGKSFNFARLFLGSDTGIAAARLYRFCRIIDDIADESEDKEIARTELDKLKDLIIDNRVNQVQVNDFLMLCEEYSIDRHHGITLIEGVSQDLDKVALTSAADLIQYAYRVAGVVGLMMAPILGANKTGYAFAIDLGIGMQLTNIARDVMEDARMQRRYLPAKWVNNASAEEILANGSSVQNTVQPAVKQLLALAETYYQSGLEGLYYLPPRNRRAIAIAAYIYRQIGRKLLKNQCQYWDQRTVVSTPHKMTLAGQALWALRFSPMAKKVSPHDNELHIYLSNRSAHL